MWFLFTSCVIGAIIGYIIYTLTTSSGREHKDTSIDAFIIDSDGPTKLADKKKINPYKRTYDKPGKQLLILYGTEYGFSEEIGKKVFDRLDSGVNKDEQHPWQPRIIDVKHHEHIDFNQEKLVFIVVSTAGDGIPPTDARPFCKWVEECRDSFPHLNYSVLALGDSNYPHFCRTGKTLNQRLLELGGRCVVPCHDVDMEDWEVINRWSDLVLASLETVDIEPTLDYLHIPDEESDTTGPSRTKPFLATLTMKQTLTNRTDPDDKETIHYEFDLTGSDITWTSGDALGIYPENNPPEVERLLQILGCGGSEPVDSPKWAYEPKPDGPLEMRDVLLKYYDLKTVRPELVQLLHKKADGTASKQELDNLLAGGISKKNTFLHEYLYEREVADVLNDFKDASANLTVDAILGQMKGLQPRYYSIASSPVITMESCCVTAAVVRYKTLGLPRTGVTTTFLQDRLLVSQRCPVFISHNPEFRLPDSGDVPVVMVGPGTGIAPFMAFISERLHTGSKGKNIFYFGCRYKEKDFLYREKLETWAAEEKIVLRTAFSRDQPQKVYVQHLIQMDAVLLYELIQNQDAHVYVCGDARHMAHDVHTELLSILETVGGQSPQQAENTLRELENCGRYQKDVWVT